MAIVEISFISPVGIGPTDTISPSSAEMISSTGLNQQTIGASIGAGQACVVVASGGPVYVAFGANPDATAPGSRRLIPSGGIRSFSGLSFGHKAAIVDAV